MAKKIHCRDIGPDCDAVVVAETEDDIVRQVVQHARDVHDMTDEEVSDSAFLDHVRNQIHDQEHTA